MICSSSKVPKIGSYRVIKKFAFCETLRIDGTDVNLFWHNYYVLQEFCHCNPAFGYSEGWIDSRYALAEHDFDKLDWTPVKFGIGEHPAWSLEAR